MESLLGEAMESHLEEAMESLLGEVMESPLPADPVQALVHRTWDPFTIYKT